MMTTNATKEMSLLVKSGSKTTNVSSLATAVSDSATFEGVELVEGGCHARSRACKYDNHWVICTGPRTCKRAGHKEKREMGVMGKPGFYDAVYTKGGTRLSS
jgi:hypothetical protein